MNHLFIVSSLLVFVSFANAQSGLNFTTSEKNQKREFANHVDSANNMYLLSYNGTITSAKTIDFNQGFWGDIWFTVDGKKRSADDIMFYKSETGFYARVYSGQTSFAQRIRKGKINLYQKENIYYSPGSATYSHVGGYGHMHYSGGGISKNTVYYYNFGFSPLKRANYNNLKTDLTDNIKSMEWLTKYEQVSRRQLIIGGIGVISILGGMASIISYFPNSDIEAYQMKVPVLPIILTTSGTILSWSAFFMNRKKDQYLKNSIDAYNEE